MDPELLKTLAQDPQAARRMLTEAIAERDPRTATMMQLMSARAEPAVEPRPSRERSAAVGRVRRRVAEMRAELIALRERQHALAGALGACARCWGDDDDCTTCGGEGGPGWLAPDPSLFDELVKPAIARRSTP